jgi:AcrR family transcriptional regulator
VRLAEEGADIITSAAPKSPSSTWVVTAVKKFPAETLVTAGKPTYCVFTRLVERRSSVSAPRPYATLLAKGEDRRQRILAVAERLLARNGWRNTSLAQIAKEAGVTPAGLLHHFESKEQLLNAVLDARDADDDAHADRYGDLIAELSRVPERFDRAPELIGTFTVLLVENIAPDAPLHGRLHKRYRDAIDIVTEIIERGQRDGRYRPDFDAATKAVEILAFINGMETLWLLDPSIPLTEVFKGYAESLARELAPWSAT